MAKKADPMEGYVLGRPFGNSPRILKKSGAGTHGGTSKQKHRRERRATKQELRSRILPAALGMVW